MSFQSDYPGARMRVVAAGLVAAWCLSGPVMASVPAGDFSELQWQLLSVDKMYMKASIQVTMNNLGDTQPILSECCVLSTPAAQVARGSLEYIAVGQEYRLVTDFPDTVIPGSHTEISFADNVFTYIDHDAQLADSTVGVDRTLTGRAFSIPVFAPYEHIRPVHPQRPDFANLKTLQDALLNEQTPSYSSWQYATLGSTAGLSTHVRSESSPHPSQLAVPFSLTVYASLDELDRPTRIEERDPVSGMLQAVTTISHYEDVLHDDLTSSVWPHLVVHELYDDNGELVMTISVMVRTLLVNSTLIDELPVAPVIPASYTRVIDGDIVAQAP
jgi:hypothetical protein